MKILDLILTNKWYDMTLSGEKTEEYREITDYWCRRICHVKTYCRCYPPCNKVPTNITHVRLHRGYTNTTMLKEVESIITGIGNPAWGAPDRETFIIKYKPNNQ